MSYQRRKKKKSKQNRLVFKIRVAFNRFFKTRREEMLLPQTRAVMDFLRKRARLIRSNNQKISSWVDEYINSCAKKGESVTIVTQLCVSKDLEERYLRQGGVLIPTKKERKLFGEEIGKIISIFVSSGFRVNWWLSFNRSYLDSGRINERIEDTYKKMTFSLAEEFLQDGVLEILDWEDDLLGERPKPNSAVLADVESFIGQNAFDLELDRHSRWAREEAGLKQTDGEILRDVCYQVACEAEEGRLLDGADSPFGDFILIPLEVPERYDFFTLIAGDFKKRIVPILKPYPWRLED